MATSRKLRCGLTIAQYDAMLKKQDGVCGVCGNPPKTRRFHVDHDHATNKVRGLLCFYCNYRVIGRHTLDKLRKAVQYLEAHDKVHNKPKNKRLPGNEPPPHRK